MVIVQSGSVLRKYCPLIKQERKMRQFRIVLSILILISATLACNAATGIRTAQTDIPAMMTAAPAMMTAAPTLMGPIETSVAEFTPPVLPTSATSAQTPSAGGLGIQLQDVKTVLQVSQQFIFSDGTQAGQPAAIARLSSSAATSFPSLAASFSAAFIGDPKNLSEIKVTMPRAENQATVDEGIGLVGITFAGILPVDVQIGFLQWISKNYADVPVNGSKETTIKNFKFNLSRTKTEMLLDILPAQ
jgi:hypothetical protein